MAKNVGPVRELWSQWLVPAARLFRRDVAAVLLVAANVVPVVAIIRRGEPAGVILIAYWMQFVVIGIWVNVRLIVVARWRAVLLVPAFTVVYHAIVSVFGMITGGLLDDQMRGTRCHEDFAPEAYLWAGVGFFLAHAVSFAVNFVGRKEYATTTWEDVLGRVAVRVMPMWLAAVIGSVAGSFLRSATAVVAAVVPVKIVLDLISHFAEHGAFARPTMPRAGGEVVDRSS